MIITKTSNLFLLLVSVQALHSIEEYFGKLWENFPPATFLCSMVSNDLHFGFLVINIGLFIVGIGCWYLLVRPDHRFAKYVILFWLIIELMNGIVHPIWTIIQREYTAGVATAPVLFIVSIYLIKTIYDDKAHYVK